MGVVVKGILNNKDIIRATEYVTRYCYATISAPFNTMHGACSDLRHQLEGISKQL